MDLFGEDTRFINGSVRRYLTSRIAGAILYPRPAPCMGWNELTARGMDREDVSGLAERIAEHIIGSDEPSTTRFLGSVVGSYAMQLDSSRVVMGALAAAYSESELIDVAVRAASRNGSIDPLLEERITYAMGDLARTVRKDP